MTLKKISAFLLAGVLLLTTAGVQAGEEKEYGVLFEKDKIIEVRVTLDEQDWQEILADPGAEEYHTATVTVEGNTVENVGFRTKGNSSLTSLVDSESERYSFRIKLDKYVEGQNLLGLDEFVVNNMFSDPSYLREYLSYEALREIGSPAPLCAFVNLYINDRLYGFYLGIEAIDNSFLERCFGDDTGNLYKQDMGSGLVYQEGSDYPQSSLKNGEDTAKTGLKNFIKLLNDIPEGEKGEIESVLDIDSALQYIAGNTVMGNYDSYNGQHAQNYYLYEQEGKFYVIPWDYNMSFGGFMGSALAGETIPVDQPVMNASMEETPLITKLLAIPEYKEKYYGYIRALINYFEGFEERVAELAEQIRPYVEQDPSKFVTMEQFENSIVYSENPQEQEMTQADGNVPPQFPEGMQENGMGRPPEDNDGPPRQMQGEKWTAPPQGGAGGGMMSGNGVSIVTFMTNRLENLKQQLAGEIPTTGNTTMNRNNGQGSGRPGQQPQKQEIKVKLDGTQIQFDQQPVLENDRTLVPLRAVFEALGMTVGWEQESQTVTAVNSDTVIPVSYTHLSAKPLSLMRKTFRRGLWESRKRIR